MDQERLRSRIVAMLKAELGKFRETRSLVGTHAARITRRQPINSRISRVVKLEQSRPTP